MILYLMVFLWKNEDKYKLQAKKIRNPGTLAIVKVCFSTLVGKDMRK